MGVFDDHVAVMGDWMPPSASPGTLFSSRTSNDALIRSFSNSISENNSGPHFPGPKEHTISKIGNQEAMPSNVLMGPNMSSKGGLMERRAARAGFNAPRLNTESIRNGELSKEQEVQSPYLTIPPGLSPTTLLDSPVFLTNSLVQPSPTTGKFAFAPSGNNGYSTFMKDDSNKCKDNTSQNTTSFAFKTIAESGSVPNFYTKNEVLASGSFASFAVPSHSDNSFLHQSTPNSHTDKTLGAYLSVDETYQPISLIENNSPLLDEPHEDDGYRISGEDSTNAGGDQAEDGYNWRKYGQKQVKGSEYPRSYYKCTHPNCPVKKKVERSHEGHITEIIYKGAHNHPKPPPGRRSSSLGPSNRPGETPLESELLETGASEDLVCLVQEYSNGATLQGQNGSRYESGDVVDGSCTFSNDEHEDDDLVTHGSTSLGYDGEGDESESKKRRIETYASEISGATRAVREPRVVVQTTSEVDILDDGYRWRKYGQKVVKGNPNPRSYYKCTSPGCNVRKHVERASHDLKSVITTYEGKHNHDVPAARNSGHVNSGGANTVSSQQAPTASHMQRPESSQTHSSAGRFERPSLGSFGLPARPQQFGPGPGFGFGLNQQRLANLGLVGLGHNQGKLPGLPVHPYLGHQNPPMSGFVLPKAEPKLEPVTDSGFSSSDSLAVYQQFMSRMPLGPQL